MDGWGGWRQETRRLGELWWTLYAGTGADSSCTVVSGSHSRTSLRFCPILTTKLLLLSSRPQASTPSCTLSMLPSATPPLSPNPLTSVPAGRLTSVCRCCHPHENDLLPAPTRPRPTCPSIHVPVSSSLLAIRLLHNNEPRQHECRADCCEFLFLPPPRLGHPSCPPLRILVLILSARVVPPMAFTSARDRDACLRCSLCAPSLSPSVDPILVSGVEHRQQPHLICEQWLCWRLVGVPRLD
jgi:hypothetical protein